MPDGDSTHSTPGPRIAYFSEVILPWVDGVSRTLGKLFDYLESSGRDFRIYAPQEPSPDYEWSRRVVQVKSLPFPFHTEYRLSMPERGRLTRDLDVFQPDVIHVCTPTPAPIWVQTYARSRGIPVAGSYHTSFVRYLRYYHLGLLGEPLWRFMRWFYNRCDMVLPPSESTAVELRQHGFRNVDVWSRGIDCQLFSPDKRDPELRARAGADDSTPLLLMVSRLVKEKDLAELIDVDRILRSRGLDFRMALVGTGPYAEALQAALPNATFTGYVPLHDLTRWYASADIFVFPSTTETFGNVVQESMASGVATVVANSGGPAVIVENGVNGLIVRPNDPADMAAKVARLIEDPELRERYAAAGRESALSRNWDAINGRLMEHYEALLARKAPRVA